jgi:lipopolysaccharide/colanic/teichoic acid biosynthesis glycosyltransferase
LRGSDIDKIPQLINVLRGEMSIVGPRPYLTAPGDTLRAQISLLADQRHVKPGIFSWRESQWLLRGD